jgi:plasmid stabilization system protein ParE
MRYEFHPDAEQELFAAAERYEREVPGLGYRFGDEINRIIQLLLIHPELGVVVDESLHHFVLRRFPFSIVYVVNADILWVVAIAHGSRTPGYWQARRPR